MSLLESLTCIDMKNLPIHITGINIFIECQENIGIVMFKRTQTIIMRFNLSSDE